jgi:hypothetical protein
VSFNTMAMSLQRMTRRVSEAAIGTGSAKKAIKELGLDAVALSEMSPEEAFQKIADALMNVEKHSDKVRIAMAVFGMQGAEMLQMMGEGSKGIQDMMDRAEALGFTLSQAGADDIAAFNDSMTDLKAIVYGLAQEIAIAVLPHLEDVIAAFTDWWKINRDIVKQKIGAVIWGMRDAFVFMWPIVKNIVGVFQDWWRQAMAVYDKIAAINEMIANVISKAASFVSLGGLFGGSGPGTEPASASAPTGAAAIAAAGGGDTSLTEDEAWAAGAGRQGSTVVINQQLSRSDVTAIINETTRQQERI